MARLTMHGTTRIIKTTRRIPATDDHPGSNITAFVFTGENGQQIEVEAFTQGTAPAVETLSEDDFFQERFRGGAA